MSNKGPRKPEQDELPYELYQPIHTGDAVVLRTGIHAAARRKSMLTGRPMRETLVDFPAAKELIPLQKVEVDGRIIWMRKV